jgi:hypothetical protein
VSQIYAMPGGFNTNAGFENNGAYQPNWGVTCL